MKAAEIRHYMKSSFHVNTLARLSRVTFFKGIHVLSPDTRESLNPNCRKAPHSIGKSCFGFPDLFCDNALIRSMKTDTRVTGADPGILVGWGGVEFFFKGMGSGGKAPEL